MEAMNIRYASRPAQLVRFLSLLPIAMRETWAESTGRICSRACSEHHQYDRFCLMGSSIRPWPGPYAGSMINGENGRG
jgi:hypothetical protein